MLLEPIGPEDIGRVRRERPPPWEAASPHSDGSSLRGGVRRSGEPPVWSLGSLVTTVQTPARGDFPSPIPAHDGGRRAAPNRLQRHRPPEENMGEFVRLEVEDGVGTIRLDRPPMNVINQQIIGELHDIAIEAKTREDGRP